MMIATRSTYLDRIRETLPADAIPNRPDLSEIYPWRAVVLHARSRDLARRVREATAILSRARSMDAPWHLSLSGKDSRAVAFLCREAGWKVHALTVADDTSMPGEDASTAMAARETGLTLDWIRPAFSVLRFLRETRVSLLGDLHTTASEVAQRAFYEPILAHRAAIGGYATLWGLRAAESRGRGARRAVSGPLYQHPSEGWRCSPIADWSALDVHAWLALQDHALHPVYHCVDPGMDPLSIRTDWWFSVGWAPCAPAHFSWLRRWWPALHRLAVEIDPEVGRMS